MSDEQFKPGSKPTGTAPAHSDPAVPGVSAANPSAEIPGAAGGPHLNPLPPGVQRGRVFTHAELWATISHVQRVAWLKRAGIIGDPQLVKHAGADWHVLEPKVTARLLGVR